MATLRMTMRTTVVICERVLDLAGALALSVNL